MVVMLNPATQPHLDWNEFTEYVRDHPGVFVKLRNGDIAQPLFHLAEDEHCSDGFNASGHRWYTHGTSLRSSDFDMMELTVATPVPVTQRSIPEGMFEVVVTRDASISYRAVLKEDSFEAAKAKLHKSGYAAPEETVWETHGVSAYDNVEQCELTDSEGTLWYYTSDLGWFQQN